MAQIHFHISTTDRVLLDCGAADVRDLTEAREEAQLVVRALIAVPGPEDWRDFMLHVHDDLGEEMYALPFKTVLGRMH